MSLVVSRMNMVPSDLNITFKSYGMQFRLTFYFAMTINKSHNNFYVGIYLSNHVFTHE